MQSTMQQPFSQDAPSVQDVKVQILLTGGHHYTIYLRSDDPLLQNLLGTIVSQAQAPDVEVIFRGLFQIPVEQGRATLCFSSEQLVGVVTEPPIFLRLNEANQSQAQPESQVQTLPKNVLPSDFVQIDDFLTLAEKSRLLNYVLQRESNFVSTSTSTSDESYRQSKVLYSFPDFSKLIVDRIQAILPDVFSKLGLTPFPIAEIETQLTAHNDGNYYKVHNDNGSPDTANREFTYVYYFYNEPKAFTGGELRLYDSKIENNMYVKADSFKDVEPRNNSIVFFPSRYLHEVLPIACPSKAFADSRFTINGWVRRQLN